MRRLLLALIVAALVSAALIQLDPVRIDSAVCGSDADCAAWEVRTGVALADRCDGAPCPDVR